MIEPSDADLHSCSDYVQAYVHDLEALNAELLAAAKRSYEILLQESPTSRALDVLAPAITAAEGES